MRDRIQGPRLRQGRHALRLQRHLGGLVRGFINGIAAGDPTRAASLVEDARLRPRPTRRFAPSSPMIAGTMEVFDEAVRALPTRLHGNRPAPAHHRQHLGRAPGRGDAAGPAARPAARRRPDARRRHQRFRGAGAQPTSSAPASSTASPSSPATTAATAPSRRPACCRLLRRRPASRPRACAMIGDSTHDLDSGRAAGMRTVGVLTGFADPRRPRTARRRGAARYRRAAGVAGLARSMTEA